MVLNRSKCMDKELCEGPEMVQMPLRIISPTFDFMLAN